MADPGVYLYGITDYGTEISMGPMGVGEPPAEVRIMRLGDMGAIVSPAPRDGVAPKMGYLLAHDRVLRELAQQYTVLPVAFGTVVPGEGELRVLLELYHGVLAAELGKLRGKVEAEVKVFWVPEAVLREAGYRPGHLPPGGAQNPNRQYRSALEVGQAVEATVSAWRQRLTPEICNQLASRCLGYRLNQPLSVQMLINAAFLVCREHEAELASAIRALTDRYAGRLLFRYVAPLPPYNFVEIDLPWRRQQSEG